MNSRTQWHLLFCAGFALLPGSSGWAKTSSLPTSQSVATPVTLEATCAAATTEYNKYMADLTQASSEYAQAGKDANHFAALINDNLTTLAAFLGEEYTGDPANAGTAVANYQAGLNGLTSQAQDQITYFSGTEAQDCKAESDATDKAIKDGCLNISGPATTDPCLTDEAKFLNVSAQCSFDKDHLQENKNLLSQYQTAQGLFKQATGAALGLQANSVSLANATDQQNAASKRSFADFIILAKDSVVLKGCVVAPASGVDTSTYTRFKKLPAVSLANFKRIRANSANLAILKSGHALVRRSVPRAKPTHADFIAALKRSKN